MKKYISEFVGTFVLVFVACGVAVVTNADVVATSLAFGLVIVAMAYSIGNVSGCHINPAVSLAMFLTKKLNAKDFAGYVVAQVIGALAGSLALGIVLKSFDALGANTYGAVGQLAEGAKIALIVEFVLTFIFVTVILAVTSKKENKNIAGIVIGLTLTLVHLIGIKFTGTSVNPARSLAPAVLQGGKALCNVWIFIVAPIVGAVLAGLFYKYVLKQK
jgi:aquaporin Z